MKKYFAWLLVLLVGSAVMASTVNAQGVNVNQSGDVVYLGTTTTTTTTIATATPSAIIINATPTTNPVVVGNTVVNIPAGYFVDFNTMVTTILQIVLVLSVLLVLFQLISAGVNWISSGGDKAKTDSARSRIVAAVVGLILVVASWAIFLFILQLLGLEPSSIITIS
jgi:hypothetical protein